MCLTGYCFRQQSLTGSGRAYKQCALWQNCTDICIFLRIMKEIHDFLQGFLRLFLTGYICKGLAGLSLRIDLGVGLSEGHGISHAAHPFRHALAEDLADDHKHQDWQHPVKNKILQRRCLGWDRF